MKLSYSFLLPCLTPLREACLCVVSLSLVWLGSYAYAAPEVNKATGKRPAIVFGCSVSAHNRYFSEAERAYRQVFSSLGYSFTMRALPRTRELAELKKGNLDGSCGRRFKPPYAIFSELIRVPVPVGTYSQVILSREALPVIRSLADVADNKRIAYVRGGIIATEFVNRYPNLEPVAVVEAEVGIKMLAAGRVDYFLGISVTTSDVLTRLTFDQPIYQHLQLEKLKVYPYLTPRAQHLLEPLTQTLEQLLRDKQQAYLFEF